MVSTNPVCLFCREELQGPPSMPGHAPGDCRAELACDYTPPPRFDWDALPANADNPDIEWWHGQPRIRPPVRGGTIIKARG